VFGCGAVGIAAVIAAKIVGCTTIIAVDLKDGRLKLAREVGATHALDGSRTDLLDEVRRLSGSGTHFAFDTTGVPEIATLAVSGLRARGTAAYVAATSGAQYRFDARAFVGPGKIIRGVVQGDAIPADFIPRMISFYRSGMLPLEKIVTTFPFSAINEAAEASERGTVHKAVLVMDSSDS
jgi:aryl-alcohol dehydrogenase